MHNIKLSVIMPAFNVERFIAEAIHSVLNQSFKDFELIIINDGSSDNTENCIKEFKDPRIILINQSNRGIAYAINKGLSIARSELIIRFDADDICYPHRFVKQYQFMLEHPEYVIAGSSADYIDEKGEFVFTHERLPYSNEQIKARYKTVCPFIHSSVTYRKQSVIDCGGYNEHAHSFEDHLLWQEVLKKGKAKNFAEPLIQVRLNPESITIDEQWRPKSFHLIKKKVLQQNFISETEGAVLLRIIREQNNKHLKEGAYYALLAKKFLWNNHQPEKARANLIKVMALNKFHLKTYLFYALSFLPAQMLEQGYKLLKYQTSLFNSAANAD